MPNLKNISITFHTHNDNKDDDTVLHVFVKNRSSTSSTQDGVTTYIANLLSYQDHLSDGTSDINPYLGFAQNLAPGTEFDDPSSQTFDIPLRNQSPIPQQLDIPGDASTPPPGPPIPLEEIQLPVVDIHILPNGNDRWIFDYTITFTFDDGRSFSSSSNTNGVTGIILDQDNRDYSGLCTENPFHTPTPEAKPQTDAVLTQVLLEFGTHNDNKDDDTRLNVHIVNRLSATQSQDIAVAVDLLHNQEFPDAKPDGTPTSPSDKRIVFSKTALPLASNTIRLQDIVLPVVNINIGPNGNDRWIFDYRVTYFFDNGQTFSSTTSGVILDQDNHKHTGVYQGRPFPTVTPAGRPPLDGPPVDHVSPPKVIPLSFLQKKLDELVNNRQGADIHSSPITKIRLHNAGKFGDALPMTYYDLRSLEADPPPPGTVVTPDFQEGIVYDSSPTEVGQETNGPFGLGDIYLNDINSKRLTVTIDPANKALPVLVEVDFETDGKEVLGSFLGSMDFSNFTVQLRLTLAFDSKNQRIDLMSWIDEINGLKATSVPGSSAFEVLVTGQFLGQPVNSITTSFDDFKSDLIGQVIHVSVTAGTFDFGGKFQKTVRGDIFSTLSNPHLIDETTIRDRINAFANSWFLGGVVESGNSSPVPYPTPCKVQNAEIQGDNLVITYTGPQRTFQPTPPAGWPSPGEFSPGTLANIDHIVVLTMENRSFDHMLGYLSLPPGKGGLGRTDVDGLKGSESNLLNGQVCPVFAFATGDTVFAPDPPHGYEPVARAVNGGKMDGFVESYAREHGPTAGPRIMGYHTAANVPTYDALVRDFAVCQRWFAPHPGPTFSNRFYETTGRLNLDPYGFWENSNSSPLRPVFTKTIFDHLSDAGVSWKYFESHYCFLRFFEAHTFDATNIATFDDPEFGFVNLARTGNLPSVSFIDPHFIELPPDANCDGPPADIAQGQRLVQQIVEAVVTGPAWDKTLLIVTYDEHGGFYDHVPPPPATPVSPTSLGTYGVRVPAFIISPWAKAGLVFGRDGIRVGGGGTEKENHSLAEMPTKAEAETKAEPQAAGPGAFLPLQSLHFDHTSILKTIVKRFLSSNPPYMSDRFRDAHDLSVVVGSELRTSQFLPFIAYNLVYGASQKRLDVQGASTTTGTHLWQFDPNTTVAQQFSFEDAGDGFVYLRTHTGNLYVTADAPGGATQPGVKQDVKYPAGGSGANTPDLQRWRLSSGAISTVNSHSYTISNAAFPGKVLQPSGDSLQSGVAVVLGDPTGTHIGVLTLKNPWQVTSPLLPNTGVVLHP